MVVFFWRIWSAQSSDFWAEPMYMIALRICVGQTEPPLSQIGATEGSFSLSVVQMLSMSA